MHKEITQQLPTYLKLLLCYRKTPTVIAMAILIIGSVFSSILLSDFDFREYFKLKKAKAVVTGVITNSYYTGISESIEDDGGYYYVNAYEYEYKVNTEDHKWVSYSRDSVKKIGEKVLISYNIDSPQYSVIKGFRYRATGTSILFILVPPIVAFIVLLFHIYKGVNYLIIINNGIITKGKLIKKETIKDSEDNISYKLNFTYYSDEKKKQRHVISIKTSDTSPFEDENREAIIFHKNSPNQSLMLDDLAILVSKYIKKNWLK